MGVDIEIRIGLKKIPKTKIINKLNWMLKDCSPIEGIVKLSDGDDIEEPERFKIIYEISSLTRYYGEGYERGPFIYIYGFIHFLIFYFKEYDLTIFYGGDCSDYISEIKDGLKSIMEHFVKNGNSPYTGIYYKEE